jgi:hypothetical protein
MELIAKKQFDSAVKQILVGRDAASVKNARRSGGGEVAKGRSALQYQSPRFRKR